MPRLCHLRTVIGCINIVFVALAAAVTAVVALTVSLRVIEDNGRAAVRQQGAAAAARVAALQVAQQAAVGELAMLPMSASHWPLPSHHPSAVGAMSNGSAAAGGSSSGMGWVEPLGGIIGDRPASCGWPVGKIAGIGELGYAALVESEALRTVGEGTLEWLSVSFADGTNVAAVGHLGVVAPFAVWLAAWPDPGGLTGLGPRVLDAVITDTHTGAPVMPGTSEYERVSTAVREKLHLTDLRDFQQLDWDPGLSVPSSSTSPPPPPGADEHGEWTLRTRLEPPVVMPLTGHDALAYPLTAALRNGSDIPFGIATVVLSSDGYYRVLREARPTPGSDGFLVTDRGFLVASTRGKRVVRRQREAPGRWSPYTERSPLCASSATGKEPRAPGDGNSSGTTGVDGGPIPLVEGGLLSQEVQCLQHITQVGHPGLERALAAYPRLLGNLFSGPAAAMVESTESEFLFSLRLASSAPEPGTVGTGASPGITSAPGQTPWRTALLLVVPRADILGAAAAVPGLTAAATAATVVCAGAVSLLVVWWMLRPLRPIAVRMGKAARLEEDDPPEGGRSWLGEIADLQAAFDEMAAELNRIRAFVPQALLLAVDSDDADLEYEDEDSPGESPGMSCLSRVTSRRQQSVCVSEVCEDADVTGDVAGSLHTVDCHPRTGATRRVSHKSLPGLALRTHSQANMAVAGGAVGGQRGPALSPARLTALVFGSGASSGTRMVTVMSLNFIGFHGFVAQSLRFPAGAGVGGFGDSSAGPAASTSSPPGPSSENSAEGRGGSALRNRAMQRLRRKSCDSTAVLAARVSALVWTVVEEVREGRGVVDALHGDRFRVTFNATRPCASHLGQAARTAARLVDRVPGGRGGAGGGPGVQASSPVGPPVIRRSTVACDGSKRLALPFTSGIATGPAVVGPFGCDSLKSLHVVGPVVSQAHALERLCDLHPGVSCLVGQKAFADLQCAVHLRTVDMVHLPFTAEPALIGSVDGEVPACDNGAQDEWMYQLQDRGAQTSPTSAALGGVPLSPVASEALEAAGGTGDGTDSSVGWRNAVWRAMAGRGGAAAVELIGEWVSFAGVHSAAKSLRVGCGTISNQSPPPGVVPGGAPPTTAGTGPPRFVAKPAAGAFTPPPVPFSTALTAAAAATGGPAGAAALLEAHAADRLLALLRAADAATTEAAGAGEATAGESPGRVLRNGGVAGGSALDPSICPFDAKLVDQDALDANVTLAKATAAGLVAEQPAALEAVLASLVAGSPTLHQPASLGLRRSPSASGVAEQAAQRSVSPQKAPVSGTASPQVNGQLKTKDEPAMSPDVSERGAPPLLPPSNNPNPSAGLGAASAFSLPYQPPHVVSVSGGDAARHLANSAVGEALVKSGADAVNLLLKEVARSNATDEAPSKARLTRVRRAAARRLGIFYDVAVARALSVAGR